MQPHYINHFRALASGGAGSTVLTQPIELPRDGNDIEIEEISAVQVEGGVIVRPNFTLQLTEQGGTNTGLFIQAQHIGAITGDGSQPWKLPVPLRLSGNVRIAAEIVKLSAAAAEIFVTVKGRRVPNASAR